MVELTVFCSVRFLFQFLLLFLEIYVHCLVGDIELVLFFKSFTQQKLNLSVMVQI